MKRFYHAIKASEMKQYDLVTTLWFMITLLFIFGGVYHWYDHATHGFQRDVGRGLALFATFCVSALGVMRMRDIAFGKPSKIL